MFILNVEILTLTFHKHFQCYCKCSVTKKNICFFNYIIHLYEIFLS